MGLCKCPQRKVTNIFCYEHRVNVCEHCLMHNHPKCVVDTYKNWITDSVYSSKCGLCEEELVSAETVRLLCLHIVHWDCLDAWARQLPPTTAPAGFSCPICRKMCLFPQQNQVSPIADELRNKMSEVNWARVGLGLSLLEHDPPPAKANGQGNFVWERNNGAATNGLTTPDDRDIDKRSDISGSEMSMDNSFRNPSYNQNQNHNQYGGAHSTRAGVHPTNSPANHSFAKLSDTYGSPSTQPYFPDPTTITTTRKTMKFDAEIPLLVDDDDKYRRRSPFESLSRWLRQMNPANRRRSRRRTALYVLGTFIGMIIMIMLLIGRNGSSDDEDNFNLHANPHVLVGEGKAPLPHDFDT